MLNTLRAVTRLTARVVDHRLYLGCRCMSSNSWWTPTFEYDPEATKPYPEPKRWPLYNSIVVPPPKEGESPAVRTYCHVRANVKYSPKKLWFISSFIRGMPIDEAVKQLSFIPKKGAQIVKEVLLEAQDIAVREHNFEFKSNMWIGESFATKGLVVKGVRRHARMRFGEIRYFYSHYFVRLVEGKPPKHYFKEFRHMDGNERIKHYVDNLRARRIDYGL